MLFLPLPSTPVAEGLYGEYMVDVRATAAVVRDN